MDFRLLGPVEVSDGATRVDLGHAKQRCVAAVLLMEAGTVVPTATLLDRVWGNEPPDSALNSLYTYVRRLRTVLTPIGVDLVTQSPGYLLNIEPDSVDVNRFRRLLAEADNDDDPDRATAGLDEALTLWRGEPLTGIAGSWADKTRQSLREHRLAALVKHNETRLRAGQHAGMVGLLRDLVAEYPLDERLVGQLMRALYGAGQRAAALNEYTSVRQRLDDHDGSRPGPHLRELHQGILRDDPGLAPGPTVRQGPLPIPAGLPPNVPGFVGRRAELAELDALIPATNTRRTVVISAIDGTAGVGKTALAVHWAHRVKGRFPDGNLYADLCGHGPGAPADPAHILDGFLTALDVAPSKIPLDLATKTALYRSLLNERRMLVLLDNAVHPRQVRPLLPATPDCLVVVTSRSMLTGLAARDRALRICLDVLPIDDAVALITEFVGTDRVAAQATAARALAQLCARLPVALCIAGERAAADPHAPLDDLVAELADQRRRLDLLDADGDPDTAVRSVFSWSYDTLPSDAAQLFRLLGTHPGPDTDAYAAAALVDVDLPEAMRLLDVLRYAHLIEPAAPGRYRMHDLLRVYAAEHPDGSEADRRAAFTRLFDCYLAAAGTAMDLLAPAERHRRPRVQPPATPVPAMAEPTAAKTWLKTERDTLTAMCAYAAVYGWPEHATRLAATLSRYLEAGCHYDDAVIVHTAARQAAHDTGDRAAEAVALTNLGAIHQRQDHGDEAAKYHRQALALFREIGDKYGQARTIGNLGLIHFQQARYDQAADYHRQALALFEEIGDRAGEARALDNLGSVYELQGRYAESVAYHQRALTLVRDIGDPTGEAYALGNLGDVYRLQGRYDQAAKHHRQALAAFRELGNHDGEAYALSHLGDVRQRQGIHEEAADLLTQALALFRDNGDPFGEAETMTSLGDVRQRQARYQEAADVYRQALARYRELGHPTAGEAGALNGLGEILHATGEHEQARAQHDTALRLATRIGHRYEQARAHDGLAHIYHATAHTGLVRDSWLRALNLYTDIGAPQARDVAVHLAQLTNDKPV